jgi:hypothetical protein
MVMQPAIITGQVLTCKLKAFVSGTPNYQYIGMQCLYFVVCISFTENTNPPPIAKETNHMRNSLHAAIV